MEIIRNMSQERMEWLNRIHIYSIEDVKLNNPKDLYQEILDLGHPEDEHFYWAIVGAARDRDTSDILRDLDQAKRDDYVAEAKS